MATQRGLMNSGQKEKFVEEMVFGVKGLIENDSGKILILMKNTGVLDLPGGRLGDGEGFRQGLFREIWEETGHRKNKP